jgi:hypothetical protein
MLHAGLDLSRRKLDVCLLSESGEHVDQLAAPPDADALRALARRIDEVYREPVCAVSKDPAREAAERAAAERAEAAYQRLVADWKASGTGGSRAGAGASQGRASEAARQGSAPGPAL